MRESLGQQEISFNVSSEHIRGPQGLWLACDGMEAAGASALARQLALFESPIRNCYEAGVQAPTLPGRRHKELDMSLAALF
jgi:hypothetical protein